MIISRAKPSSGTSGNEPTAIGKQQSYSYRHLLRLTRRIDLLLGGLFCRFSEFLQAYAGTALKATAAAFQISISSPLLISFHFFSITSAAETVSLNYLRINRSFVSSSSFSTKGRAADTETFKTYKPTSQGSRKEFNDNMFHVLYLHNAKKEKDVPRIPRRVFIDRNGYLQMFFP
jgi:hypothetical protein